MAHEVTWNPNLWKAAGGTLPEGWQLHPFEDFLESPKSIAVGVMYPGNHSDDGTPLIRVGDVQDGGVVDKPAMRISGEVHHEYRRTALAGNELLITLVGKPGVCTIAQPYMAGWNVARALAVAKLKSPKLRPYLKAVLESSVMKSIISGMLNTTVQPTLNLKEIKSLPVPMPNRLEIADAIGDFSELFGRRIDLLRQINTTLESITQALFKSWFIDFDPVRAKAEGREPEGMDADTAALFPDSFEDSALGQIPKGWRPGTLGEVASNPRSQAKPGQMPSSTPYIGLEHMPKKSISLDRLGTAEGLESGKFWFEQYDVLFGKLRPYFHKVGLAPCRGVCSTDILVIRPREPNWLGYVVMHASSDELIAHTTLLSNGARMPRTSWQDIDAYKVVLPDERSATAFNNVARPFFERIFSNMAAMAILSELRDTLLPRLISGKLRLPEAEAQLNEALA